RKLKHWPRLSPRSPPRPSTDRSGRSVLRLAYRVGNERAPSSKRFVRAYRGVASGLVLDLRVQFRAEQNDDRRQPEPHHQADGRGERPVGRVVVGEAREIEGQEERSGDPGQGGEATARAEPLPARFAPARAETVEKRQPKDQDGEQDRPAQ